MPASIKSKQSECQVPVSTSNYTSRNVNYSDGHQIREAVLAVSGKEIHVTNDVAEWMAANGDLASKNDSSSCENNRSLVKKSKQESPTYKQDAQVAHYTGKNPALKEILPLPGSPAIAHKHYSQEQIYENYPFCASFSNSSSASVSEMRCSKNTALITPVGDQEKAQKPLCESQLFSSSQVDQKESDRVHTKQPKSTIDRTNQVNLTTRQLKQVASKQMDRDAGDICHLEAGNSNTGYNRRGDLKDYNFDQFQANGNNLAHRKERCLNIAANSMTSNSLSTTNNFSNNYVQRPPNSFFCSEKDSGDQRRVLSSVSSDPEVYAKTPSTEKLNVQIQKLRHDMLALRSTTASYKKYMENIFDELKTFVLDHDHEPMLRTSVPADISVNEINEIHDQPQLRSYLKDCVLAEKENEINEPFSNSKFHIPVATSQALNAFSSTPNSTHTEHRVIHQVYEGDCSPTRRIKITERPNSDPFVSCAIGSEEIFSGKPRQDSLMPTKYAVKSADSSLENGSKRAKGTSEELRILSVLCKSNAGHHISECSIDSGYQGSFIISPKDRLGRELSSQTVTPASPISESPVEATITNTVAMKQLVVDHCLKRLNPADLGNNDSFLSANNHRSANNLSKAKQKDGHAIEKIRNDFLITNGAEKDQLNNNRLANVSPCKPQQQLKSYDRTKATTTTFGESSKADIVSRSEAFTQVQTQFNSSASGVGKVNPVRPIPKQRTIFSIVNSYSVEDLASVSSVLSSEELKARSGSLVDEKITLNQIDGDGQNLSVSRDVEKASGSELVNQQCPTRPTPPQCLTVIKPNTQSHVDSGSPLQSRVKLGVSAIKQLTPNNERKEGSVFYCSGQVSQATNDARSRMRKTANTKQLLREKFAAAVERSNAAAAKKEGKADSDENEWSMVRRRSMRMMTEFQIFDFKDGSASKNLKTRSGETHFNRKQHRSKTHSSTPKKLNQVEVPPESYSVSPSAATVSKDIFLEKDDTAASTLLQSKPTHSSFNASKINPTQICYTVESLPPPPPCTSQIPRKEEGPITGSSIPVLEVPSKQPVFLAPIIRPKASVPSKQSDELTDHSIQNTAIYHGLKLSPNSKSAFKPVVSSNDSNDPTMVTENTKPSDVQLQHTSLEPKCRLSLPQTSLSNKQRFINEFMPDSPLATPKLPLCEESLPVFQRDSSMRAPRKNVEVVAATETTVSQSYSAEKSEKKLSSEKPEAKKSNEKTEYVTTEPLFSKLPKKESSLVEDKRRRHASTSKATTSAGGRLNLENQPIQFDKSEKLNNVVGALRNAGYLRPTYLPLNTQKTPDSATSSLGKSRQSVKENNAVSSPALPRERNNFPLETHGQIQACFKARSSSSLHQYETVKIIENSRDGSGKLKNARVSSKDVPPDETSRPQARRSHKSTIALIRASLLGKRDKTPRTATAEGKRERAVVGEKVRSSSVGDKLKLNESSIFEIKPSKSKSKEKSKKSKSQKDKASGKKTVKEAHQKVDLSAFPDTPNDETFIFPSPNELVYGNPDSEVMERFLAAAAAAAADNPRSPLQRLRSSFRTPKHKNRIVHETRIKDDMAVPMRNHRTEHAVQSNTKMHNGQEFTYV